MNEKLDLQTDKKHIPRNAGASDVAALRGLLSLANNPALTGAVVPKGADVTVALPEPQTIEEARARARMPELAATTAEQMKMSQITQPIKRAVQAVKQALTPEPITLPPPPSDVLVPPDFEKEAVAPTKIFFTGRLMSGKDFLGEALGAEVFGFADPMYQIASEILGIEITSTKNKEVPGVRKFLQQLGQWGKGDVNEDYPLTPERALFVQMIRDRFNEPTYGLDSRIWVNKLFQRANQSSTTVRVVTNCRFKQEYDDLIADGWTHFHVMCSPATWAKRLAGKKLTPQSPQVNDMSEKMAAALDSQVQRVISQPNAAGNKLHVIWNDETIPSPSPRLWSTLEFVNAHRA